MLRLGNRRRSAWHRRRALPVWLSGPDGDSLWQLAGQPDDDRPLAGPAEALAARLLAAATVTVTGVHLDDLDPEVTAVPERPGIPPLPASARVALARPGAAEPLAVRLGYGLALAVAAGAPVLVADAVLDRLAVAGTGDDLSGSLLARARRPVAARPGARPRFEPRNLTFDDGLDWWGFGGSFRRAGEAREQDYSCSAADNRAVISVAVAEPHGFAALHQVIVADDYRGATVVFGGEIRTAGVTGQAGLHLLIGPPPGPLEGPLPAAPRRVIQEITGSQDWARHEVTAEVPDDAGIIRFGIFLAGPGRIELRRTELTRDPARG